jgi:hypothetical protein
VDSNDAIKEQKGNSNEEFELRHGPSFLWSLAMNGRAQLAELPFILVSSFLFSDNKDLS